MGELEQLRRWKAEATSLFDGMQDLGRALDLPLGVLVTGPSAVEAANRLRERADAAEAEASNLGHDYDRRGERLWRLAAKAGHVPSEADNDAVAEMVLASALERLEVAEAAVDRVRRRHPRGDEEPGPLAPGLWCPGCGQERTDGGFGGCPDRLALAGDGSTL